MKHTGTFFNEGANPNSTIVLFPFQPCRSTVRGL